jgi:Domain of unknown function (DUF4157)
MHTTGSNVFFRAGAYDPGSPAGRRLLTHETTHIVQQAAGPLAGTLVADEVAVSDPADAFEQAAQRAAEAAATAEASTSAAPPRSILPLVRIALSLQLDGVVVDHRLEHDLRHAGHVAQELHPGPPRSARWTSLRLPPK